MRISDTFLLPMINDLGHLNARVLSLFRRANIELLDLSESIEETNELNLSGSDVLKGKLKKKIA